MNQEKDTIGLSQRQLIAMQTAQRLADVIERDCPEIAQDYCDGLNQLEIVYKYHFEKLAPSIKIAREAVGLVLRSLISEEDRQELKRKLAVKNGEDTQKEGKGIFGLTAEQITRREENGAEGRRQYQAKAREQGTGFYGMTTEERRETARRNKEKGVGIFGLTSEELSANAKKAMAMGVGLHGMTFEQRSELGKRNWRNDLLRQATLAKGLVPWENYKFDPETGLDECSYLLDLADQPDFILHQGKHRKRLDFEKIAATLNKVFHDGSEIRYVSSVKRVYKRARKRKH
ncbi:hypothetical protein JXD20_02185 [Candidatus Peregrinibacteria bacterium]|nr:hypothetical protein [Candidatus Peregrinibacteria bacterium]